MERTYITTGGVTLTEAEYIHLRNAAAFAGVFGEVDHDAEAAANTTERAITYNPDKPRIGDDRSEGSLGAFTVKVTRPNDHEEARVRWGASPFARTQWGQVLGAVTWTVDGGTWTTLPHGLYDGYDGTATTRSRVNGAKGGRPRGCQCGTCVTCQARERKARSRAAARDRQADIANARADAAGKRYAVAESASGWDTDNR